MFLNAANTWRILTPALKVLDSTQHSDLTVPERTQSVQSDFEWLTTNERYKIALSEGAIHNGKHESHVTSPLRRNAERTLLSLDAGNSSTELPRQSELTQHEGK